jgi:antitoxin (DNA-binding transcriptional repressor) of toxin-antitoxin stability system
MAQMYVVTKEMRPVAIVVPQQPGAKRENERAGSKIKMESMKTGFLSPYAGDSVRGLKPFP